MEPGKIILFKCFILHVHFKRHYLPHSLFDLSFVFVKGAFIFGYVCVCVCGRGYCVPPLPSLIPRVCQTFEKDTDCTTADTLTV